VIEKITVVFVFPFLFSFITKAIHRVAQKSKPLPNGQKIVLNRIKTCE